MDYPMTAFIVKLLLFNAASFLAGLILGTFMGSPEFGVGIFLLLMVYFKGVVFSGA
jgi:hypothetical protein